MWKRLQTEQLHGRGCAIVAHQEGLGAEPPPGTSAQKAELRGPHRALHLGAKKKVFILILSLHSLSCMHMGPDGKRGLLTSGRKETKHTEGILALLDSVTVWEE